MKMVAYIRRIRLLAGYLKIAEMTIYLYGDTRIDFVSV